MGWGERQPRVQPTFIYFVSFHYSIKNPPPQGNIAGMGRMELHLPAPLASLQQIEQAEQFIADNMTLKANHGAIVVGQRPSVTVLYFALLRRDVLPVAPMEGKPPATES